MIADDLDLSPSRVAEAKSDVYASAVRTPLLEGGWLGEQVGGEVKLKAECLQATGSFKVRGVSVRLAAARAEGAGGVVAASAGNHAQALAFVAKRYGMPCRIYMPSTSSVSKAAAVVEHGATLRYRDKSVDGCIEDAQAFAEKEGATFVHPFDDPLIVLGQATLGAELMEEQPDLGTVIVPVGGGGLISGVAAAVKGLNPAARIVGVQAEVCAPFAAPGGAWDDVRFALADGIAIKRPGKLTQPLVDRYVDELCTVSEDAIAEAIVALLQSSKLVVEGAGAVGVAALLSGAVELRSGETTAVVLSGGNIDLDWLSAASRLHEAKHHTGLHLSTKVPDHPGGLATFLTAVAEAHGNVLSVEHVRDAGDRSFHETGVEVVLQTRGEEHGDSLVEALRSQGWEIVVLSADAG